MVKIYVAAENGKLEEVKRLVGGGVDIEETDPVVGYMGEKDGGKEGVITLIGPIANYPL